MTIHPTPGKPLSSEQAYEVARSRGYDKSFHDFLAWSQQYPVACQKGYGLRALGEHGEMPYEDVAGATWHPPA